MAKPFRGRDDDVLILSPTSGRVRNAPDSWNRLSSLRNGRETSDPEDRNPAIDCARPRENPYLSERFPSASPPVRLPFGPAQFRHRGAFEIPREIPDLSAVRDPVRQHGAPVARFDFLRYWGVYRSQGQPPSTARR
jgi:hypothetical protein